MQKKGGSFLKENISGMRLASKNTNPSLTGRQGEKPKKKGWNEKAEIYLNGKGILKQTSFLETHIVSSSSNVDSGRKPVFLQHRQEIKHLGSVTPYKCKMANEK